MFSGKRWNPSPSAAAAHDRLALTFALSAGQAHDAPAGRKLLAGWEERPKGVAMVTDRAYEGDETRQLVLDLGFEPVVQPHPNRLDPVQRLFRRLKGFRRIFSRFEKLDLMFTAFLHFVLIVDMLCVNTP